MRIRVRSTVLVAATVLSLLTLSGCGQEIPRAADPKEFCSAGEQYSALRQVPYAEALEAGDRLAEVGTPVGIDKPARQGFEELISRMKDSSDAAEFRQRTRDMSAAEKRRLMALDSFIQRVCLAAG